MKLRNFITACLFVVIPCILSAQDLDYKLMTCSYWVEVEPGVHEQRLPSDHYPIGVHVIL